MPKKPQTTSKKSAYVKTHANGFKFEKGGAARSDVGIKKAPKINKYPAKGGSMDC